MNKKDLERAELEKAKEEQARPYRVEIVDVGNDVFSVKSPILISKERLEILNKICDITGEHLKQYIEEALYLKVKIDLENPTCFGQTVCETLLDQWGPTD